MKIGFWILAQEAQKQNKKKITQIISFIHQPDFLCSLNLIIINNFAFKWHPITHEKRNSKNRIFGNNKKIYNFCLNWIETRKKKRSPTTDFIHFMRDVLQEDRRKKTANNNHQTSKKWKFAMKIVFCYFHVLNYNTLSPQMNCNISELYATHAYVLFFFFCVLFKKQFSFLLPSLRWPCVVLLIFFSRFVFYSH